MASCFKIFKMDKEKQREGEREGHRERGGGEEENIKTPEIAECSVVSMFI